MARPTPAQVVARAHEAQSVALWCARHADTPDRTRAQWLAALDDALQTILQRGPHTQHVDLYVAFSRAAEALNLADQIATDGYATGLDYIEAGQRVLGDIFDAGGLSDTNPQGSAWTLTAQQRQALADAREAFAQQLAHAGISGAEWVRLVRDFRARCAQALAADKRGRTSPGVRVIDVKAQMAALGK